MTTTISREGSLGIVTLNRPEARNALNAELRAAIPNAIAELEADDSIDVIVLTGADPAFCAGLDLKELGGGGNNLDNNPAGQVSRPFAPTTKPLIGAINGVAITGGFELALNCDFLIASDRAAFADTHSRVGVMPGWGLTVLLSQAIGVRRAKEMSTTGNFMGADEALAVGLVNRVVPHDTLLDTVRAIAADISSNDQRGVRQMLATYDDVEAVTTDAGWEIEAKNAARFRATIGFDPETVESRREAIADRGRAQLAGE